MALRGVVFLDYDKSYVVYSSPCLSRAFLDGVSAAVMADIRLQQDYVFQSPDGPPSSDLKGTSLMARLAPNQKSSSGGGADAVRFVPRAASFAQGCTKHLARSTTLDLSRTDQELRPPHHMLPTQVSEHAVANTPVLHTGAVLCVSRDHPWVRPRESERLQTALHHIRTATALLNQQQPDAMAPSAASLASQLGPTVPPAPPAEDTPDDLLMLWRLAPAASLIVVFCLDNASANVPLAQHCMSVLLQLLPEAVAKAPGVKVDSVSGVPHATTLAALPDVVEHACDIVCPCGQGMVGVDVSMAKQLLRARFSQKG